MIQAPLESRPALTGRPTVSVVVCAYTERRWGLLLLAVESVRAQDPKPDRCIVVVDHNDLLLRRARAALPADVEVIANEATPGLSGARNTAIAHATTEVIAFLDDDAAAEPQWLATLLGHYASPTVVGVGGVAEAVWPEHKRPRWFPPEFDWVVGCSYIGLPQAVAPVRNPIGCSMSLRSASVAAVGGFDAAMGRVGTVPLGCEETELAVRIRQNVAGAQFLHVPGARVRHHVSPERARVDTSCGGATPKGSPSGRCRSGPALGMRSSPNAPTSCGLCLAPWPGASPTAPAATPWDLSVPAWSW